MDCPCRNSAGCGRGCAEEDAARGKEEENMALTKEQVKAYLDRIGVAEAPDRTWKTLAMVQEGHLTHIPYENLDILRGVPLDLTEEGLFRKLVERKRGGYCFEQNGLLYAALTGMGFSVTQFCGRFIDGTPETVQDRRHRVLRVEADDGVFICDVGVYGESPRKPLRFMEEEIQSDGICEYRYLRDPFYGWVECQRERGKDWKWVYGFTEEPWLSYDFEQPSFFCEKHPASLFNTFRKVGIFRGKASLTYLGDVFTEYEDAAVRRRETVPEERAAEYLRDYFGLEL